MRLEEFIGKGGFEVMVPGNPDGEVSDAYVSDLLSDAMAHCPADSVFITVQNHKNAIAVATLVGAPVVLVCHGRDIPEDMSASAATEKIALLRTSDGQFQASVKVGKILGLC